MNVLGKRKKWPRILGIILGAVAVLLVYIISFAIVFDEADVSNSMKDVVSVFTCITTALTAIFTGASVANSVRQHQESRQAAIFTRWYDEIILNRHLDKIKDFCSNCEMLISELIKIDTQKGNLTIAGYEKQIKSDIIAPFTGMFTCIHKSLVSDLALIDGSLSINVSKTFQELQDKFVGELDPSHDHDKMHEIVQEFDSTIMKQLMEFNKQIMQGKGLSKWING